jgi:hypothetical protein
MDEREVAKSLRSRSDPASRAAVECLDAGGNWWPSVELVSAASERQSWLRRDLDWANPHLRIIGRDESAAGLAATELSTLEKATIDQIGLAGPTRFFIYVAPSSDEVVACVGVISVSRPPDPVFRREEVPETIAAAAGAFVSHTYREVPAPYEVLVHREFDAADASQITSVWVPRGGVVYRQARSIATLGAAEVTFRSDFHEAGRLHEGYLLVLDVVPSDDLQREWTAAVWAHLLRQVHGSLASQASMTFRYQ